MYARKILVLLSLLVLTYLNLSACQTKRIVETRVVKETAIEKEAAIAKGTATAEVTPGLGRTRQSDLPSSPTSLSKEPRFGGTFRAAAGQVPPTLDAMGTSSGATSLVTAQIMEHLVDFYEDYSVGPMLAESWDISKDGMTYTFHLRKGVKFHDGSDMTSEDVIASLERYLEVGMNASAWSILESYEAPDDYTVVMHLTTPSAAWPGNVANPSGDLVIFPKEIIEGQTRGEIGPEELIGTGPYYLAEYQPDQYAILKRFEDYQPLPGDHPSGLGGTKIAYFDEIHIDFATEPGARIAGLEAGDYDWVESPPATELERIRENPDLHEVIVAPRTGGYILFNHANEWSSDIRFREAVLAGIEMEPLLAAGNNGVEELYTLNASIWPAQTHWYWEDDYAEERYNWFDVDAAKSLLEELGYGGQEIVIATTRTYDYMYRGMLALADQLQHNLGMNVTIKLYDWPALFSVWKETGTWHISVTANSTLQLLRPEAAYTTWGCESVHPVSGHYCDAQMEAAFDALHRSATRAERLRNLRPLLHRFWKDLPNIKIGEGYSLEAIRSDLLGYVGWGRGIRFYGTWRAQ